MLTLRVEREARNEGSRPTLCWAEMESMKYIISEFPPRDAIGYAPTLYVVAPSGWMLEGDHIVRDGTPLTSGPEWGKDGTKALRFDTHRAAARVLSKCGPRARIVSLKMPNAESEASDEC